MYVDPTHCLSGAVQRRSPHCDVPDQNADSSAGAQDAFRAELIVLHCISLPFGEFGTGAPSRLFTGELDCNEHSSFNELAKVRVAPHLLIDRQGQVEQFVSFDRSAWHAGQSSFAQRPSCNRFSLGIELEGTWTMPYTDDQYRALTAVCVALFRRYPALSPSAIVGHQEVAPGRKEDPGPFFDWARLLTPLHGQMLELASNVDDGTGRDGTGIK